MDAPEAGKPELPQQEPALGPGQKVDIPEAMNEVPLPKADAPNPLGGLFGGEPYHIYMILRQHDFIRPIGWSQ